MESMMLERLLLPTNSQGSRSVIPVFLYGCAWKKNRTSELVYKALAAGFTGVDVAAQPKHYNEAGAGEGIRRILSKGKLQRGDLFIQSKYTPFSGQDPTNLPYDPRAPIAAQVHASIASSLQNLRTSDEDEDADSYLDSLVLHSPLPRLEQTKEAWQVFESYVPGKIRHLGISNTTLPILRELHAWARVKPAIVQNRFHAATGYEVKLRQFCRENGIIFQSFWTLSANPWLLKAAPVMAMSRKTGVQAPVVLYAFVLGLRGTVVLNGTQNHMTSDVQELAELSNWSKLHGTEWQSMQQEFNRIIGETP